jgi:hypothetical protein
MRLMLSGQETRDAAELSGWVPGGGWGGRVTRRQPLQVRGVCVISGGLQADRIRLNHTESHGITRIRTDSHGITRNHTESGNNAWDEAQLNSPIYRSLYIHLQDVCFAD